MYIEHIYIKCTVHPKWTDLSNHGIEGTSRDQSPVKQVPITGCTGQSLLPAQSNS